MAATVLHVLSQRPGRTGSGVTLDALVRCAADAGWMQAAVVGTPADDPQPAVATLPDGRVFPLVFGAPPLLFPLPGMSDVMPYPSSRFSALTPAQVDSYRQAWSWHLRSVIDRVRPDLVHVHHLWLVAALLKDDGVAPELPVVNHVHGTGLRQMELCPHLADGVRRGCAKNDRFAVLHADHGARVRRELGVDPERLATVGAGYREDLFHARGRADDGPPRLLYVGKLSAAKGVPQLLDAFAALAGRLPDVELHLAGAAGGAEGEAVQRRLTALERAVWHGPLEQAELGALMRRSTALVLPSYFEGLPLVLVEGLACGCRLVATRLPGIESGLAPHLGEALTLVDPPPMESVDLPRSAALPAFVERLTAAMEEALTSGPVGDPQSALPGALEPFTWRAVFRRVERLWRETLDCQR